MKPIINIEHGQLTIELSPFQCASLAKACHLTCEKTGSPDVDEWRVLGTLFQACSMIGLAQWHMSQAQLEALTEQLVALQLVSPPSPPHAGWERRNGQH
ncbi:hypothetical protein QUF64_09205 [Anaerolineales bacterium HSG6]|nr:hypothetical protein [Anaerolineales bacterium HSG6]